MPTRYVVLNENTLGYFQEGMSMMGVLAGNVFKNGHSHLQGVVPIIPGIDKLRPATREDFADYRVSTAGHFPENVEVPTSPIDVHKTSEEVSRPRMSYSEALALVHELALANQLDEHDQAFGGPGLVDQARWQQAALDAFHDFTTKNGGRLDELSQEAEAGTWPDTVWEADRSMNPENPGNAIRICLELAESGALLKDDVQAEYQLAEYHHQQQAFAVTRDLLGQHNAEFDFAAPDESPAPRM